MPSYFAFHWLEASVQLADDMDFMAGINNKVTWYDIVSHSAWAGKVHQRQGGQRKNWLVYMKECTGCSLQNLLTTP